MSEINFIETPIEINEADGWTDVISFVSSPPVIVKGKEVRDFQMDWREYLVYSRDAGPDVIFIGVIADRSDQKTIRSYRGYPAVGILINDSENKWERKFVKYSDKTNRWEDYQPKAPIGTPSEYYSEIKSLWMPDRFYPSGLPIKDKHVFSYNFDIIEGSKDLDRFSIDTIGRRGEPIEDKSIRQLYPTKIEDILVYYDEEDLEYTRNKDKAVKIETPTSFIEYPPAGNVYKDAFTTVKQQLFRHTNYNEQVSITSLPLYEMEVNRRNYIEYDKASIRGLYLSKKITFNFDENSLMNVSFIRVNPIDQ